MKFVIKRVPKFAIALYLIGLLVIAIALTNYFTIVSWFDSVTTQQVFILGAILVAFGSVVNTIFQFKKNG